jgi:glutathione synthase/RimK-type ligase-like ATP-grasp enzyme
MNIAFLTCADLLPGAARRRKDAFEHDFQIAALREGLGPAASVIDMDWRAPADAFEGFDAALLGTAWDYQDRPRDFMARLDDLASRGVQVFNPPEIARWNIDKRYLCDLETNGAASIPTLWRDDPCAADVTVAFETFGCDRVVVKRCIGAGAEGQIDFTRDAPPPEDWRLGQPGLIQPFLPSILTEGEYSLVFVSGEFSHAVQKRPAAGDYRIQSSYGGVETAASLPAADMLQAARALQAIPFPPPHYARVDMVRGVDGTLRVMEVELIEPYLYPVQGPRLGDMLARAILGTRR